MVQDTEKALEQEKKDKQIAEIKAAVRKTLEEIEKYKEKKEDIEKRIKYLRMDLEDFQEGKLDRIEERQAKDPDAKSYSVIIIIKEKVIREVPNHWYWPYTITIQQPIWAETTHYSPSLNWTYCTSGGKSNLLNYNANSVNNCEDMLPINCSLAKDYSAGTYEINGKIINFR